MADDLAPTRRTFLARAVAAGTITMHEPGIYLDMPMREYVNDPALSGSGFKKLLTSPADWRYELPDNDLYEAPETDDQAIGSLVHCAVFEGLDTFEHRYRVTPNPKDQPAHILRTADDIKGWLKDHGQKVSGTKDELMERTRAHWQVMCIGGAPASEEAPIFWDEHLAELRRGGVELIKEKHHRYVHQVHTVVTAWPEAQDLLAGGIPEVSIFWEENGVRYKARPDLMSARARIQSYRHDGPLIVDGKKFGRAPRRGKALWQHLQGEVLKYDYDMQAVHNRRAAMTMPLLLDQNCVLSAHGENASARIEAVKALAEAFRAEPPLFAWLFLRTPGPPQGLIMPFPDGAKRWDHAESDIEQAVANFVRYRDQCGDGLWVEVGVMPWDDEDLPEYAWEIART